MCHLLSLRSGRPCSCWSSTLSTHVGLQSEGPKRLHSVSLTERNLSSQESEIPFGRRYPESFWVYIEKQ